MQENIYRIVGPEVDIPFEANLDDVLELATNLRKKPNAILSAPSSRTINASVERAKQPVREYESNQPFETEPLNLSEKATPSITDERKMVQEKVVASCRNIIRCNYLEKSFTVTSITEKLNEALQDEAKKVGSKAGHLFKKSSWFLENCERADKTSVGRQKWKVRPGKEDLV